MAEPIRLVVWAPRIGGNKGIPAGTLLEECQVCREIVLLDPSGQRMLGLAPGPRSKIVCNYCWFAGIAKLELISNGQFRVSPIEKAETLLRVDYIFLVEGEKRHVNLCGSRNGLTLVAESDPATLARILDIAALELK